MVAINSVQPKLRKKKEEDKFSQIKLLPLHKIEDKDQHTKNKRLII